MILRGVQVGFGAVAENAHAPAYLERPDFEIAAVVESLPDRRAAAARVFPKARLYAGLDECLAAEERLDFADIATPPFLHARQATACLERGLHVLCEKPLAFDDSEVSALRRLSESTDRALFCVHNWKHAPALARLLALVREGAVGEVSHVQFHALRDKPAAAAAGSWRTDPSAAGGGIIVDHGWHAFYLVHALCGGAPLRSIHAALARGASGADEEATALLQAGAASAVVHLSWRAPARSNWALVQGRKGSLELRDCLLVSNGNENAPIRFPEKLSEGSAHPGWFSSMLSEFRSAVSGGPERRVNLDEAAFCASAIDAARGRPAPEAQEALAR